MVENKNDNSIVVLIDENGNEVEFDHLLTFRHLDKTFIALLPLEGSDEIDDDEVLLLQVEGVGEDEKYISIENEVLLEEVFDVFMELFDQELDAEDDEDDLE